MDFNVIGFVITFQPKCPDGVRIAFRPKCIFENLRNNGSINRGVLHLDDADIPILIYPNDIRDASLATTANLVFQEK